jgi:hypothetical protein
LSYSNLHTVETGINPDANSVQLNAIDMVQPSLMDDANIKAKVDDKGFIVVTGPNFLSDYIKYDVAKWAPIVKHCGATAE